jgi:prepilin-type N-terminal cleavage/methylation domain-containing protein
MRKAFTLVELLVVVGIMGLLGTLSVGGYRAMQRGMAERGVMQNVNYFVKAAYQRAQIDRQPTVVYFWNETLREATDYESEIVVGKAVAVRRNGRITKIDGQFLYDEFADLNMTYQTSDEESGSSDKANSMFLYPVDRLSNLAGGSVLRSVVDGKVHEKELTPLYLSQGQNLSITDESESGRIKAYAFKIFDQGGVTWQAGMAYGFEFARIELPHNFIFGSSYSTSKENPVKDIGSLVFDVGYNAGDGVSGGTMGSYSIQISSLRPNASGLLSAESIGQSDDPTRE